MVRFGALNGSECYKYISNFSLCEFLFFNENNRYRYSYIRVILSLIADMAQDTDDINLTPQELQVLSELDR